LTAPVQLVHTLDVGDTESLVNEQLDKLSCGAIESGRRAAAGIIRRAPTAINIKSQTIRG
jgi:hypothetical protein